MTPSPSSLVKSAMFPLVHVSEHYQSNNSDSSTGFWTWVGYLIHLTLMISSGYLAWMCNQSVSTPLRVVYTILAAIFSLFYLIYYGIYHKLMGVPCAPAL